MNKIIPKSLTRQKSQGLVREGFIKIYQLSQTIVIEILLKIY